MTVRNKSARASVARASAWFVAALAIACSVERPAQAETRNWVVSWFTLATYSQDGDCPEGLNPDMEHAHRKNLTDLGFPKDQVERIVLNSGNNPADGALVVNRGRIDGKPVNIFQNPTAEPDPNLFTVKGRYALGFNLDGKGASSPNGFEDPVTHEQGVNNELFRAGGCIKSWRAMPPVRSLMGGEYQWGSVRDSMQAWLISISGEDLSKDGTVTVTFDRALSHAVFDNTANVRRNVAYRIDPDPRSHNVFQGKLENGVISSIEPVDFRMFSDPYVFGWVDMAKSRLRLKIEDDGQLKGILGGYRPWYSIYWEFANGGSVNETFYGTDIPGLYYALRRLADAYPDPKTGKNTRISSAYAIEAVPAVAVPVESAPVKSAAAGQNSRAQ